MWYNTRCNLCGKYIAYKDRYNLLDNSIYNSSHIEECEGAHKEAKEIPFFTLVSKSEKFIKDYDYIKIYPDPVTHIKIETSDKELYDKFVENITKFEQDI